MHAKAFAFHLSLWLGLALSPTLHGSAAASASLARYFDAETARVEARSLSAETLPEWEGRRGEYRTQLMEMLGLSPLPPKTPLQPRVTGRVDHEDFVVENVVFESLPGLYVTGNLYLPKNQTAPAPAILYVCGHARVVRDGVSHGNKTAYQRHGAWFARNGYVCLTIDTLQLGEIEGLHHGTHHLGMWWWNSRGYTPAGVEAWNNIRALDYLETRPEVDANRFGVTGRSGGGGYSWVLAAADERIKAAVPVAGLADLRAYVVDGTVAGHCDCMFVLNTHRLDYPLLTALIAPRPLLIGNSDKDELFPLESVVRLHSGVRDIYRLYGAEDKLGLLITEGPHRDTQDLQVPAFRWFNRHLMGEESLVDEPAVPFFSSDQLRVFSEIPADQINTTVQETFVPAAPAPALPRDAAAWETRRGELTDLLSAQTFAAWPDNTREPQTHRLSRAESDGVSLEVWEFTSQEHVRLPLYVLRRGTGKPSRVRLHVLDEETWPTWGAFLHARFGLTDGSALPQPGSAAIPVLESDEILVLTAPRGIGPADWGGTETERTQIRRRFALLGQTVDGMRVWDIRRAVDALKDLGLGQALPVTLDANGAMAVNAAYASLYEDGIAQLDLHSPSTSHRQGPEYLNVLRFTDVPEALALAASRTPLTLSSADPEAWAFVLDVSRKLGWPAQQATLRKD